MCMDSFGKQPSAKAIDYVILGVSWTPLNNHREVSHAWHWGFCLIVYGYWGKHYPTSLALIHHSLLSTNLPFPSELARNSMVLPSFFSVLSSIFFSQLHPHWLSQFPPAPVTYYDLSRASQHSLFLLFGFLWLLQVIQTYIKSTVLQPQHHLL